MMMMIPTTKMCKCLSMEWCECTIINHAAASANVWLNQLVILDHRLGGLLLLFLFLTTSTSIP